ncbi:MAG: hypothetical protein ACLGXA_23140 [Acidobacteriota bacterium]
MGADAQTRNNEAGEHLELLRSLAREVERAMHAIAQNNLAELEDSIASQQDLSVRLTELAMDRRGAVRAALAADTDGDLRREVQAAAGELQKLNLRYSMLIEHSSRSAAQMAALFSSFRGQFQEESGGREKHQTLSFQG